MNTLRTKPLLLAAGLSALASCGEYSSVEASRPAPQVPIAATTVSTEARQQVFAASSVERELKAAQKMRDVAEERVRIVKGAIKRYLATTPWCEAETEAVQERLIRLSTEIDRHEMMIIEAKLLKESGHTKELDEVPINMAISNMTKLLGGLQDSYMQQKGLACDLEMIGHGYRVLRAELDSAMEDVAEARRMVDRLQFKLDAEGEVDAAEL